MKNSSNFYKRINYLFFGFILLFIFLYGGKAMAQSCCIKVINAKRLYSRHRAWPFPRNNVKVKKNPPALLWPTTNGKDIKYKVRLSQDSLFKSKQIIKSGLIPWAMYTSHQSLKPGKWYWQYGIVKSDKKVKWSSIYSFNIESTTPNLNTPSISKFLKDVDIPHPRLWLSRKNIKSFRVRNSNNPEAKQLIKKANSILVAPLPKVKPLRYRDTTGMSKLDKKLTLKYMYHGFGTKVFRPIKKLCVAYMLTGNKKYAKKGIKEALRLASFNPNGVTSIDDFNIGLIMEAMALVYDKFYKYLSAKEKDELLGAIKIRGNHFYSRMINNFEARLCDNHIWQHILQEFTYTAVATLGDIKDAKKWTSYAYEIWSTRFPVLNTTDGGWNEGNGYFQVHFQTLIYLPLLFKHFTGVNYFKAFKWFRNLPMYMIYTFPPNSATTGIGDKHETSTSPTKTWIEFADALSYELDNPYFNKYVKMLDKNNPSVIPNDDKFLLFRLLKYNQKNSRTTKPLANLGRARLFKDIGLGISHSNWQNRDKDLMVSFWSSPFGTIGHGHAAENTLNVNWGGKYVFDGTGYYSNFSDKHNLLHYRTTRAYNTILADSLGQSLGPQGYGWIARSIKGKKLSYFLGVASNAYTGKVSKFWQNRFKRRNIKMSRANGIGNAHVKKFRRHVITLGKNIIIVYDVLSAKNPIRWTWQLQGPLHIHLREASKRKFKFVTKTDSQSQAIVKVFTHQPAVGSLTNKFNAPAINWKGKARNGKILTYPKQWHGGVTSEKTKKMRFLSIYVVGFKNNIEKYEIHQIKKNKWRVDKYIIKANLDANRKPQLKLKDLNDSFVFGYNTNLLKLDGQIFKAKKTNSSILVEKNNDKITVKEVCDTLPGVAKQFKNNR
jgi:hypothetical protein